MTTVHDVAASILERTGPTTAMKLQKLAYYAKAWHAVWDDQSLFDAEFQAWRNGPVCRDLYELHRGQFQVTNWPAGDPSRLTQAERDTVDVIVNTYGTLTAQQLSDLTHSEAPWRNAREGLDPGSPSVTPISLESMVEYYSSLNDEAVDVSPF